MIDRHSCFTFWAVAFIAILSARLEAQTVGLGYQLAESNQSDMLELAGPGVRLRLRSNVDLLYDYLRADGRRFDSLCGGFPGCDPELISYSSQLHSVFVASRIRIFESKGFIFAALPEVGILHGRVSTRSVANGAEGPSAKGLGFGGGGALELSTFGIGGIPVGAWIAVRYHALAMRGNDLADSYDPLPGLDWLRSAELGVSVTF